MKSEFPFLPVPDAPQGLKSVFPLRLVKIIDNYGENMWRMDLMFKYKGKRMQINFPESGLCRRDPDDHFPKMTLKNLATGLIKIGLVLGGEPTGKLK